MISLSGRGFPLSTASEVIDGSVVVIPDSIFDARVVDSQAMWDSKTLVPVNIKDYYFDSHAAIPKDDLLNCP